MIALFLDTHSGVPPYLQIVQQVKQALKTNRLQVGDRLPTVKEVAAMMVVNPNTVFKAYQELETQGFIAGRIGNGTFVTNRPSSPSPEVQEALLSTLSDWLTQAHEAGLDMETIEALIKIGLRNQDKER